MLEYLTTKIAEKQAEIAQIELEARHIEQRLTEAKKILTAYEDILAHSDPTDDLNEVNSGTTEPSTNHRISKLWREFLEQMSAVYPSVVSIDAIRDYIKKESPRLADDNIRSQLSVYAGKGWLERVDVGEYRITESGAAAVGRKIKDGARK